MITSKEEIYYEGGPAKGDLILNLLAGITIIGLPFTVGAVVRALWLRFKITTKRISVEGGWLGRDKTQVGYSQIKEIKSVPRGFGSWGDMVIVMNDNARLEMRSVPRFRKTEQFILERMNSQKATIKSNDVEGFAA